MPSGVWGLRPHIGGLGVAPQNKPERPYPRFLRVGAFLK